MDESGLLMTPLVRRSWGPKGHPPPLPVKAGHRDKVSVAAALWLTPARDHIGLAFQTLVNGYYNSETVADFVRAAITGLTAPVILLWDGGTMHGGEPIRDLLGAPAASLDVERLPPHASDLMPVEFLWRWLKYDRLCNLAPRDAHHLNTTVLGELEPIRHDQKLLRSFFHQSRLPLPRALLS